MTKGVWYKAAASTNGGGGCVEWRETEDGVIEVADTKQTGDKPVLTFTKAEWSAFLEGVGTGDWMQARMS